MVDVNSRKKVLMNINNLNIVTSIIAQCSLALMSTCKKHLNLGSAQSPFFWFEICSKASIMRPCISRANKRDCHLKYIIPKKYLCMHTMYGSGIKQNM